jgi:hypothetical protein
MSDLFVRQTAAGGWELSVDQTNWTSFTTDESKAFEVVISSPTASNFDIEVLGCASPTLKLSLAPRSGTSTSTFSYPFNWLSTTDQLIRLDASCAGGASTPGYIKVKKSG